MTSALLQGFYLGELLIEPLRGQISGRAGSSHLPPKAAEVLLCLAAEPGEVVPRETLLEAVWGAGEGSPEALSHAVSALRHALDDHASDPVFIQTLPRRGYRLLVEPIAIASDTTSTIIGLDDVPGTDPGLFQNLRRRGVIEAAVAYSVIGWLLIQVADIVFDQLRLPDWTGTFVTILVIAGFPIVILVSWYFEFRDGRAVLDRLSPVAQRRRRFSRTYFSVVAALALASVGVFLYDRNIGLPSGDELITTAGIGELPPIRENSFAVLPFLNVDGSEHSQIFANGLVDDVITRLSQVAGLRVSSRGDSFDLTPNSTSRQVRERLRVEKYLEGSVATVGNTLRVTVQLIDTASGFHILSRTFDRSSEDIFDIRDEITGLTVANVRAALPPDAHLSALRNEERPTLDAYVLYRRGVDTSRLPMSAENLKASLDWFDAALAVDAGYAAAHAGKCTVYISAFFDLSEPEHVDSAQQSCNQALRLNPNLPVVHAALGELYLTTGRTVLAGQSFQQALDVDSSNVEALKGMGDVYQSQGRLGDAEAVLIRAVDMHPGDASALRSLGNFYYATGAFDKAADQYAYSVALDPDHVTGYSNLAAAYMMNGDFKNALPAYEQAIALTPTDVAYSNLGLMNFYLGDLDASIENHTAAVRLNDKSHLAWSNLGDALWVAGRTDDAMDAYTRASKLAGNILAINSRDPFTMMDLAWINAMLGNAEKARELMDNARSLAPEDPFTWYYDALVRLQSGDRNAAIEALSRAADTGYPLKLMAADPLLAEVRQHPGYEAILAGN